MQLDRTWFDDSRSSNDYSGVWEVATQITPDGWTAEFQIPFSQMRFNVPPGDEMVWGFNVRRNLYRRGEFDLWVPTPRGQGRVDRTNTNGAFFLRQPDPWGIFRRIQLVAGGGGSWNGERMALGSFVSTSLSAQRACEPPYNTILYGIINGAMTTH